MFGRISQRIASDWRIRDGLALSLAFALLLVLAFVAGAHPLLAFIPAAAVFFGLRLLMPIRKSDDAVGRAATTLRGIERDAAELSGGALPQSVAAMCASGRRLITFLQDEKDRNQPAANSLALYLERVRPFVRQYLQVSSRAAGTSRSELHVVEGDVFPRVTAALDRLREKLVRREAIVLGATAEVLDLDTLDLDPHRLNRIELADGQSTQSSLPR